MAKKRKRRRKEKPESSGRRGFFRDLMVQAIEVGEHIGKNMAERARPKYGWMEPDPHPLYDPAIFDYDHHHADADDTPYGPPWPPAYGPPIPMELQKQMREWHKSSPMDTVSRGGHGDADHDPPD